MPSLTLKISSQSDSRTDRLLANHMHDYLLSVLSENCDLCFPLHARKVLLVIPLLLSASLRRIIYKKSGILERPKDHSIAFNSVGIEPCIIEPCSPASNVISLRSALIGGESCIS